MEMCLRYIGKKLPELNLRGRLIVLPIPTTKDKKLVAGTHITLTEVADTVEEGTLVAGYGIPENIAEMIRQRGGVIYDGAVDEEFLEENAEMTAVGAIARIICSERRFISGLHIGVVGFGRIGRRLVRHLLFLGARVRVYSGSATRLEALHSSAVEGRGYGEMAGISELDILINTAPARLVRECDVDAERGPRIVELASGDGLYGVPRVEKMASVPSVMFPESAGEAYGERIVRALKSCLGREGEGV